MGNERFCAFGIFSPAFWYEFRWRIGSSSRQSGLFHLVLCLENKPLLTKPDSSGSDPSSELANGGATDTYEILTLSFPKKKNILLLMGNKQFHVLIFVENQLADHHKFENPDTNN